MSRPRTPTKVLELRGTFKKHPERKAEREREPEPKGGLGKAPATLDEAERARWKEIAKWCTWLTIADRPLVEITCQLWMLARKRAAGPGELKQLVANLTRLGMTPSNRSKVKVPDALKKIKNPFSAFA